MSELTVFQKWYGRDAPPPRVERLHAGPLSVEFENGDLRYLRLGQQELVRRIYVAVRDFNWDTIPAQITDLVVNAAQDHFRITYAAYHSDQVLKYRWKAVLEGRADGTLACSMDGVAEADFRYDRIGFCVLHPIQGIAGQPYQAQTPQGPVAGVLPVPVEPQRMENGFEAPLFPSFSNLTITLADGTALEMACEGDLFEMEDQRNWTDGSYKTYCTPISLGYPYQAHRGQTFHQKITLTPRLPAEPVQPAAAGERKTVSITLGQATGKSLPKLGFGLPPQAADLTAAQIARLARLRPDHLKLELRLAEAGWLAALAQAQALAGVLDCQLELALFLPGEPRAALDRLKAELKPASVARVLVFAAAEAANGTTQPRWMDLARQVLGPALPGVPFIGGTNGNFAELNRQRPEIAAMDGVCYTVNAQVHAFDERSLVEALAGQCDTVETARAFSGELPVVVSSVTLKPPFNVAALETADPVDPLEPPHPQALPASVDPRQMALFGAAWTAGSLGALTTGGAASATYYEVTGWRGLMETEGGRPIQFPSFQGMVYPLYWVFACLAEARGARQLSFNTDQPLRVNGLALQKGAHTWLLVSNYQPIDQSICLCDLPEGQASALRLNQDTFNAATAQPDAFWDARQPLPVHSGQLSLNLQPYETLLVDIQA